MHFFDEDIATKYGIAQAILFQHIAYQCHGKEKSERDFFDGRYWYYDSVKALCAKFPYMSKNTIIRAIATLTSEGIIVEGNYNKLPYDRTKWYAVTDKGESIYPKSDLHLPKTRNGTTQSQEPIPDNNTPIYIPNNNKESDKSDSSSHSRVTGDIQRVIDCWNGLSDVGICRVSRVSAGSNRYKNLRARLAEYGVDDVLSAIGNIRYAPWLLGSNKSGWMIDFDWFVRPNNFPKVLEGKYGKAPVSTGYPEGYDLGE